MLRGLWQTYHKILLPVYRSLTVGILGKGLVSILELHHYPFGFSCTNPDKYALLLAICLITYIHGVI